MIRSARLRILETTDLHMHLVGYDYGLDRADPYRGLGPLADLITARRAESGATTLLFDNGDFLQGTPLADDLMHDGRGTSEHPMALALNTLHYDAVTLGNHDCDYGIAALSGFVKTLRPAVVSANLSASANDTPWDRFAILPRDVICSDGSRATIKIGVTGFAPPLARSDKQFTTINAGTAARETLPRMLKAGADLVIALCHAGVNNDHGDAAGAALSLAAEGEVDVLLLGHTHDRFPDLRRKSSLIVNQHDGTLHGKPAVMAGAYGTSLGEIDLDLRYGPQGWQIAGHQVRIHETGRHILPYSPARRAIERTTLPAHRKTLEKQRMAVGHTSLRLHNHLATVCPDPVAQLLADIIRQEVKSKVGLTAIAAVAPFVPTTASEGGLTIDIRPGEITVGDVQRLFSFSDKLCAVRRTGAEVAAWLEQSAGRYNTIKQGLLDQPLFNTDYPAYHCDAMYGLRYKIDLSKAANPRATWQPPKLRKRRISEISLNGEPVLPSASYIVGTTDFRARGGGGFRPVAEKDIIWTSSTSFRDIINQYIVTKTTLEFTSQDVWQFREMPETSALFQGNSQATEVIPSGSNIALEHADGRFILNF